jgi:hypothetical protein
MNYLKSVIKTTCIARHLSDHAVSPPHVKRFRQPAVGSQRLTEQHLIASFNFSHLFTNQPPSVSQLCYTGEKLSCLVSIESFEFLTPLKICFTYNGPYNCVKSNRKKHTRGLNLNLIKEVP